MIVARRCSICKVFVMVPGTLRSSEGWSGQTIMHFHCSKYSEKLHKLEVKLKKTKGKKPKDTIKDKIAKIKSDCEAISVKNKGKIQKSGGTPWK